MCVPLNFAIIRKAKWVGYIPSKRVVLLASVLVGMAGAFADLAVPTPTVSMPDELFGVKMPPFHIDDNLVVPVFTAWCVVRIFAALSLPADVRLSNFMIW